MTKTAIPAATFTQNAPRHPATCGGYAGGGTGDALWLMPLSGTAPRPGHRRSPTEAARPS